MLIFSKPARNPNAITRTPSLYKLGVCLVYEALVLTALCFACAFIFIWLVGDATHGVKRYGLQLLLWVSSGAYFVWCWHKGGQTLAMQSWRLKLTNKHDELLTLKLAVARYILATASLMLFGMGFLWAIFDPDHLFLHDRLLKTHIVNNA